MTAIPNFALVSQDEKKTSMVEQRAESFILLHENVRTHDPKLKMHYTC